MITFSVISCTLLLILSVDGSFGAVCSSPACSTASKQIQSLMDTSQDPCNNFYKFACGNFQGSNGVSTHKILDNSLLNQLGTQMSSIKYTDKSYPVSVRTAASAYQKCMAYTVPSDGSPITTLLQTITDGNKKIGNPSGWPIVTPGWNYTTNKYSVEGLIGVLQAYYNVHALISGTVDSDWNDPTQYSFYVKQAPLVLGSKAHYTNTLYASERTIYLNFIVQLAQLLRKDYHLTVANVSDASIMADAQAIVAYETAIARKKIKTVEQKNFQYYNLMLNYTALKTRWNVIDWKSYFTAILGVHNSAYLTNLTQKIIVNSPGFLDRMNNDIAGDARTVTNYLLFRLIYQNLQFLPITSPYFQLWADFQQKIGSSTVDAAPQKTLICAKAIRDQMPLAAGYLYVTKIFHKINAITDVQNMISNLQAAFDSLTTKIPWMDSQSKYAYQVKNSQLAYTVGWASWLTANQGAQLDQYYNKVNAALNQTKVTLSWYQMYHSMILFERNLHFNLLGKTINRLQSYPPINYAQNSPATQLPIYWTYENLLWVPAGMMNPPYYQYGYPAYMNYGGLGQAISAKWMSAFNSIGAQFNAIGKLQQIISSASYLSFSNQLQCLSSQFSKFCYDSTVNYLCVDGSRTLTSNFNELTSIATAYQGYKLWEAVNGVEPHLINLPQYSSDQMFFITYAQSRCHSYSTQQIKDVLAAGTAERAGPPANIQVIGSLQNLDIFAQAFSCKRESNMWPQQNKQCFIINQPLTPPTPAPGLAPAPTTKSPYLSYGWTLASRLLRVSIDPTVNPCTDFYSFACGNWIKKNPVSSSVPFHGTSNQQQVTILNTVINNLHNLNMNDKAIPETLKTANIFYQSCINAKLSQPGNIKALLYMLDTGFSTKGYPMITVNWPGPQSNYDMWTEVALLESLYAVPTLLFSSVSIDWKHGNQNALYISPGGLALGSQNFYKNTQYKTAYTNLIEQAGAQLSNDVKHLVPASQITADAKAIVAFEKKLAGYQLSHSDYTNNPTGEYNEYSLGQMINKTKWKNIDWKTYVKTLNFIHNGGNIGDRYIVTDTNYLESLSTLLQTTPNRTIINYLGWRLIYENMFFLSENLKQLKLNFLQEIKHTDFNLPLPKFGCAQLLQKYMPFATARAYIAPGSEPNVTKYSALQTAAAFHLQKVVNGFQQTIKDGVAFDSISKYVSTIKFNSLVSDIGFPKWILNNTALDLYHKGYISSIKQPSGTFFFTNLQYLKKNFFTVMFNKIHKHANRKYWSISPISDTVQYYIERNSLILGLGSIMGPKYRQDFPQALNFGMLGSQIGMQLGQGITQRGLQFYATGGLNSWASKTSSSNLNSQGYCLKAQFDNFCYKNGTSKICVLGGTTMQSNIADLVGVKSAYNAFRSSEAFFGTDPPLPALEEFSSDHLFFLSFAYGMCDNTTPKMLHDTLVKGVVPPNKDRVNGVLMNMPQFAAAFKCTKGAQKMAPTPKSVCLLP